MKKRVLVIGASGMAGHVIYSFFKNHTDYETLGTTYRTKVYEENIILDIKNGDEVKLIIEKFSPHFIINAVGVLISGSKKSISNTIYVNSYFPHFLEDICFSSKIKLIHISTDCVFSGKKGKYREFDIKDARDVYGLSKSLGEINNRKDLTIRTSIIGPEVKLSGEGLFHWYMSQPNNSELKGFLNHYWSGVTTLVLAQKIFEVLESNITGVLHLTNNERISKHNLLLVFKKIWNKAQVSAFDSDFKDKSFINTIYPELTVKRSYEEMLQEMKIFIDKNQNNFYKHNLYL